MVTKTIAIVSPTGTWTVPNDWSVSGSVIRVFGAGGGGRAPTDNGAVASGGGGGGAYSAWNDVPLVPGQVIYYSCGGAGLGGTVSNSNGQDGGDTWVNFSSNAAPTSISQGALAKGGKGATSATGALGGLNTSGFGNVTNSGGQGGAGASSTEGGGGGGGSAAHALAFGSAGGDGSNTNDGGGGGGGGTGGSGLAATTTTGGGGGNQYDTTKGPNGGALDTNGNDGTNGAGGGGGGGTNSSNGTAGTGGNGGDGTEYTYDEFIGLAAPLSGKVGAGGGGGGGGGSNNANTLSGSGGNGGLFGGGGGGAGAANTSGDGGIGGEGLIVITYTVYEPPSNLYWVGGTGTWSGNTFSNWALTSGGSATGGDRPGLNTNVYFDASSDSGTGFTVTIGTNAICNTFSISGIDQTVTLSGANSLSIYGSLIWPITNITNTYTGNILFLSNYTSTTLSANSNSLNSNVSFDNSGTWTLNSSFVTTQKTTLINGTLVLGSHRITSNIFSSAGSGTRSITRTTGNITLTGNNTTIGIFSGPGVSTNTTGLPVIINNSGSAGTRTILIDDSNIDVLVTNGSDSFSIIGRVGPGSLGALNFTGFSGTWTNAITNIFGNLTTSSGMTLSAGTGTIGFYGNSTITSNSKTFDFPVEINTLSGTVQLADNLTIGSTRTLTHLAGNLFLSTRTLSVGIVSTDNSTARTIEFGTGKISLTGSSTTVWSANTATNLTISGSSNVELAYSGSTGIRIVNNGLIGGSASKAINVLVLAAGDTVKIDGYTNDTTFANTFTGSQAVVGFISGNVILSSAATGYSLNDIAYYQNTSKDQTLTTYGTTVNHGLLKKGTGDLILGSNLTIRSPTGIEAINLQYGNISLQTYTLNLTHFRAPYQVLVTGPVSIKFGTGSKIVLAANAANSSSFTVESSASFSHSGTSLVETTGGTSGYTVTLSMSGLTEATALNWNFKNTTTGTISLNSSRFNDLTIDNNSLTVEADGGILYGNLLISGASPTIYSFGGSPLTFSKSSGIQTINTNGDLIDIDVVKNGSGTLELLSSLTVGALRYFRVDQGTFTTSNYAISVGRFVSSSATTRTVTMGSTDWTLTGTGTVWDTSTTTGLTFNKNTANILLSDTSTSSRTFSGGGLTYNKVTIGGTTGTSTTTFVGSNTFGELASTKTVAHTVRFTAGTTTTVTTWSINGTDGNPVTITSPTAAQHTLSNSGEKVTVNYLNISYSNATGGATWVAYESLGNFDSGNNTGWLFYNPVPTIRLTNTGDLQISKRKEFDEVTQTSIRMSANVVYAAEFDEVTDINVPMRYTNTGTIQVSGEFDEITPVD